MKAGNGVLLTCGSASAGGGCMGSSCVAPFADDRDTQFYERRKKDPKKSSMVDSLQSVVQSDDPNTFVHKESRGHHVNANCHSCYVG